MFGNHLAAYVALAVGVATALALVFSSAVWRPRP